MSNSILLNQKKQNYDVFRSLVDGSITSIDIPFGTRLIRNSAFYYYTSLASVTITNSVTSIGDRVFYFCNSLASVMVLNPTPPTLGTNAFYATSTALVIYVPAESVSAYQTAWSAYSSKIQAIS